MDPFEIRMQFISQMKRLNATQSSIQKVVGFAIKYFPPCGEDIWECIIEECKKGSINSRINILYFLDSLCETCLLLKSRTQAYHPERQNVSRQYVDFVNRDLADIVESVVPPGREGLPNLTSTRQILESWRSKRLIDPHVLDEAVSALNARQNDPATSSAPSASAAGTSKVKTLKSEEILRRIEEDRERHKRLRERRWVQPPSHCFTSAFALSICPSHYNELSIDIEFNNDWETTSDWNEDDEEAAIEESEALLSSTRRRKRGSNGFRMIRNDRLSLVDGLDLVLFTYIRTL
ncbi:CTD kinase subunit gamma CTK3-domain-containing protein [Flagelloscypha sp. PMI_526]|nr:CTD kinase subunit gamma CTK3-domain-containing protein [Flagelloscypha sp. PMI_526]